MNITVYESVSLHLSGEMILPDFGLFMPKYKKDSFIILVPKPKKGIP